MIPNFKFKDTWKFRESAIFFEKNGRYNDGGIKDTLDYTNFWKREEKRCIEGLTVDGIRISGYHYFYLNYCPIEQKRAVTSNKDKTVKTAAESFTNFPKFWDLDWMYFTALDIAEYGIEGETLEEKIENYNKLPLELDLILDMDNLSGGKHLLWLKFRGCGASWKGASMPTRNFFFLRKSKSYMYADSTEYLLKDGVFNKFLQYKSFINTHTPFFKYSDVKNDLSEMHVRASHKDNFGNERGYMSEVMAVSVAGKPDKVRGKRGKLVLFEEFGTFNKGGDVFSVTRSSLEELNLVFGTAVLYGTAGIDGKSFETMERMFFAPRVFGFLRFNNVLDDDMIGTECAFFTPADLNVANVDSEGNSDRVTNRIFIEKQRAEILRSSDPLDAAKAKMEHPLKPSEALLRVTNSILPKAELLTHKTQLVASGNLHNLAVYGFLEDTKDGVKFKPTEDARPVLKYPHDLREDNQGCISLWEAPYRTENGSIPDNLYVVCVDPYMHDSSQGDSLGAAYVIKNINNFSRPDDMIVASFVGRPVSMDLFHKHIRQLSEYYNAKIGYENNAGQGLLSYFKNNKKLHLLAPEFELGYNENIPKSSVKRGFGMHIDGARKKLGISYLADWLVKQWMTTEDGEILYNYHKINDIGLLDELIKYQDDRNLDRISAIIIAMFHLKEIEYKVGIVNDRSKNVDTYFSMPLFQ
jgi:hypothetical protein